MEQLKPRQKISKKTIVLILSCVIAFLFVISGLNKPHLSTFTDNVEFDGITSAAFSGNGGVVVDSMQQRMLILDEKNQLTQVVDVSQSGSLINKITGVTIYDGEIYVMGAVTTAGNYYDEEKVLIYDFNGKVKDTLYSQTYAEEDYIATAKMKALQIGPEGKQLAVCENQILQIIDLEKGEAVQTMTLPENMVRMNNGQQFNEFYCMGNSGKAWRIDVAAQTFNTINLDDLNAYPAATVFNTTDPTDLIKKLSNLIYVKVVDTEGNTEAVTCLLIYGDTLYYTRDITEGLNENSVALSQATYHWFFALKTFCYWISLYWLIFVTLSLIIELLTKRLSNKGKIVLVIIMCILIASGFYTFNSFSTTENEYRARLTAQSKQIGILLSDYLALSKKDNNRTIDRATLMSNLNDAEKTGSLQETLKDCCDTNGREMGVFATIWLIEEDGTWIVMADSQGRFVLGQPMLDSSITENIETGLREGESSFQITTPVSVCLYAFDYITDAQGNPCAIIGTGCFEDTLIANATSAALDLFVNLTAIFIAIFISISALGSLKNDFKTYKDMKARNIPGKEVMFNGTFQVVFKLMNSMDMAIQVYVAQSLCVGVSDAEMAVLVALPVTACSIGMWIGTLAAPTLMIKIGKRRLSIIACIGSLASLILTIFAIGISSIYAYAASKLLFGLFSQGVLFVVGDNIPYLTSDSEARTNCIVSSQQAQTAAIVIATLVGGYVSQYVSYAMMYAVAAIFAILLIPVCIIIFSGDKNREEKTQNEKKKSSKESWLIFLKPVMIIYLITFLTPRVLLSGYSGYLFPLYTAGAGISVVLLSNISVFSQAFSYVVNAPLNRFADRFNRVSVMVGATLIMCAGLVCFLISPNVWWAIVVLFIITSMSLVTNVGNNMYVADYAEECGQDAGEIRANNMIMQSALYVVRTPVLSAFISLGNDLGCAAVGLVCSVLTGIFGLCNKIRERKKAER